MVLNKFTVIPCLFNENCCAMGGKIFIAKPTNTVGFMSRELLRETWQRLGGATSSSLGQVQGAVQRPFMHPASVFQRLSSKPIQKSAHLFIAGNACQTLLSKIWV
jgi:hypothetical protein